MSTQHAPSVDCEADNGFSRPSSLSGLSPASGAEGSAPRAHLHPDPVVHAQPEEQQGAQEHRLEQVVQRPREPAAHQEGQGEERVCKARGRQA